jgi:hypothetical protein
MRLRFDTNYPVIICHRKKTNLSSAAAWYVGYLSFVKRESGAEVCRYDPRYFGQQ